MQIQSVISKIKENCEGTEQSYVDLSNSFPKMLSNSSVSSSNDLMNVFQSIKDFKNVNQKDNLNVDDLGVRYNEIIGLLNKKIENLNEINTNINDINDSSEQIAVIALNALVVSIKSGEKGRAFSCITDSLQRFSKDMIRLSGIVVEKKEKLIKTIKELKENFTKIQIDQEEITKKNLPEVFSKFDSILVAADPLQEIIVSSKSVFPLIRKAMESVQFQDLIKQALKHVQSSLLEFAELSQSDEIEKKLDVITFNISLLQLSKIVLQDLDSYFEKSISSFDESWNSVQKTLDYTEQKRVDYINEYLETNNSTHNISLLVESAVGSFNLLIQDINNYNSSHESISYLAKEITTSTDSFNNSFKEFDSVITSLKHIQILQSIEVSKNKAIGSVHDIVSGMDSLISHTEKSLENIQNIIKQFMLNVTDMIQSLSDTANEDDDKLKEMQKTYASMLSDFQQKQIFISKILNCFQVYPPEFATEYKSVNSKIQELKQFRNNFFEITNELSLLISQLDLQRKELLKEKNVTNWKINDEKMKDLITNFTITSHKESAAKLAGFEVESESSSTPGEITLF